MSDATTIRVHRRTWDLLRAAADADRLTVDSLIQEALEARAWRRYRRQADADVRRLAADPREKEWAQRIRAEMDEWER